MMPIIKHYETHLGCYVTETRKWNANLARVETHIELSTLELVSEVWVPQSSPERASYAGA